MESTKKDGHHSNSHSPEGQYAPNWLKAIGDLPDHYHGHVWHNGVMPNNYMFFLRNNVEELAPTRVTQNLHQRYEFVINYSGSGRVCLGDDEYDFNPGSSTLIPPETFHRYYNVPEDGFLWLFFTFDLSCKNLLPIKTGVVTELTEENLTAIKGATQTYLDPCTELDIFEAGLTMGRVCQSAIKGRTLPPKDTIDLQEHETNNFLKKIARFVDREMDFAVRIDDIAKHLEMSESNLRKVFRENFGVSLGAYLRQSRLTRGVQLINRPDLSISDVAKRCGFESINSFSQSFSRAIGMPPSAYRQHLAEGKSPIHVNFDQ
ncbi:AraC family transcriptional regulator [Cerasicoccus frondis]|uniref:AraC family transcriptional regulator n=1 Tax=Cerasicoccus frondis TaxID=490090 RepID=UPI002852AA69|nr:AraC family transcriptional regulator [Cerasicoccus frondis]